mgnify:CR=1 FL=1|tara:strand:+ start:311 stop:739 length:429 start_codon:yes stop_codon:yes gene_type:complete
MRDRITVNDWLPPVLISLGYIALVYAVAFLAGCKMTTPPSMGHRGNAILDNFASSTGAGLGVLSWVGGVALLGGIAALVITRGSMGVRAVLIGTGLVMLGFAVERYADWIFIPVIIATGVCSFALAYRTIRQAWFQRKGTSG